MKVLHFILGKANKDRANGVNQVIAGIAKYSARHGAKVRVIGKAQSVEFEGERICRDGFEVEAYSRWNGPLRDSLADAIKWADAVHLHGVYAPWNLWAARLCTNLHTPYVLTLHNGLAPELAFTRGRLKKRVFHDVLQRSHLRRAAGIHVLTEEESTDVWACASPRRVFCIPNGVDLEDFPRVDAPTARDGGDLVLGYLGRLSPEKNLDALCRAFLAVNAAGGFRLLLAGPDSDYARGLIQTYGQHGVQWVGPKYGAEKREFIRTLDLFINPTLCDVFSIAAMEVLAIGTPLLITRTAKVCYFYDRGAFFMCEPTAFGLERGLRKALAAKAAWPEVSARGRALIEDRLNWSPAAEDLLKEYERILDGRPQ